MKTIDMSPEAVTRRMQRLDQLWQLTVALKSSDLKNARPAESTAEADRLRAVSEDEHSSSDSVD